MRGMMSTFTNNSATCEIKDIDSKIALVQLHRCNTPSHLIISITRIHAGVCGISHRCQGVSREG